jgi:hypothetical protein
VPQVWLGLRSLQLQVQVQRIWPVLARVQQQAPLG